MDDSETLTGHHGSYTVQQRQPFAQGRISVLYKATDPAGETVCIKWFNEAPSSENSGGNQEPDYWTEISAQMTLHHPNILPVLDYGKGSKSFIVYPLCLSGTLRDVINEREFEPFDKALPILKQVAAAIDYAHSSGIIHGDIKPENILFKSDRSTPMLGDFGMSKHFPHIERIQTIRDATGAGSSAYLSPEQLNEAKQSPLSDIYTFGIVSYELLTGRLPFDIEAPPFKQMQMKVTGKLIEPLEANPNVSPRVSAALLAALSLDRNDRPKSATDFYRTLTGDIAALDKDPGDGEPANAPRDGWLSKFDSKSQVAIVTAIIAGLVAIVTAFVRILPDLLG